MEFLKTQPWFFAVLCLYSWQVVMHTPTSTSVIHTRTISKFLSIIQTSLLTYSCNPLNIWSCIDYIHLHWLHTWCLHLRYHAHNHFKQKPQNHPLSSLISMQSSKNPENISTALPPVLSPLLYCLANSCPKPFKTLNISSSLHCTPNPIWLYIHSIHVSTRDIITVIYFLTTLLLVMICLKFSHSQRQHRATRFYHNFSSLTSKLGLSHSY